MATMLQPYGGLGGTGSWSARDSCWPRMRTKSRLPWTLGQGTRCMMIIILLIIILDMHYIGWKRLS